MDKRQLLLSLYASLWEAKTLLPKSLKTIEELFDFLDSEVIPGFDSEDFDTFQDDLAQAAIYLSCHLDK